MFSFLRTSRPCFAIIWREPKPYGVKKVRLLAYTVVTETREPHVLSAFGRTLLCACAEQSGAGGFYGGESCKTQRAPRRSATTRNYFRWVNPFPFCAKKKL